LYRWDLMARRVGRALRPTSAMTVPRVGHERLYGSAWSPNGIGEYSLSELSPPAPPAVAIIALVLCRAVIDPGAALEAFAE